MGTNTNETRVLAKYDFRSKQEYIYKTNRVREIVGASEIITFAYRDFFDALKNDNIFVDFGDACIFEEKPAPRYVNKPDMVFDPEFRSDLSGKIIYVGGGNLYMLWKNEDVFKRASGILCKMLREKSYGLSAVCGKATYTGEYKKDMKTLNDDFEKRKVMTPPFIPTAMLPFTEIDRQTSLPVAHKRGGNGGDPLLKNNESISEESYLKRQMYKTTHGENPEFLDDMVAEKGSESLLAVIYIDGNNMGNRVSSIMDGISDYRTGVKTIRKLSNSIQEEFVSTPRKAIDEAAKTDHNMNDNIRWIVSGGDEITFICNARAALKIVGVYFKVLSGANGGKNTACAGIAVFHSHFPFSKAYEIAEQCCENAKKVNRRNGSNKCIVDFQFIYSGVTGDLKSMRKQDGDKMARPYLVSGTASELPSLKDDFILRAKRLRNIGRASIKDLSSTLFDSDSEYRFEIERLNAREPEAKLKDNLDGDKKCILDIAQFYDMWFSKKAIPNMEEYYNDLF